ncbi:MAG: HDOD domain-containing protein [Deltaproteobacteria bacterium]|nr:HDOD domain-containing protein [Deltaproteobacteria bacterium]
MTETLSIQNAIQMVPPFTPVAQQLIETTLNPTHRLADVVAIVEADRLLANTVLNVVNSGRFGFSAPVISVRRAIVTLGDKSTTALAVGYSALDVFSSPMEGYEAAAGSLWEHSLRTAIVARELSALATTSVPTELAYTAGLLHDIGKMVLSALLVGKATKMVAEIGIGERDCFLAAEREEAGTDHCQAGVELAVHWALSPPIQAVCGYHHYPNQASESDRPLVFVVHLADIVAMMAGCTTGADEFMYPMNSGYREYVSVDVKRLHEIMMATTPEFDRLKNMLVAPCH